MRWLTRVAGGITALLRRSRRDEELDAELATFLDLSIADKMRTGMSRDAATRAARMELGSAPAVKDRVRDVGWETTLETTWQDIRYGARTLRRSPGVTAAAVVSLALSIGANTAIFSLLNALLLRPLPVSQPEQLVEVLSHYPGEPRMSTFWWRHYEHYRDRSQSFEDLLAVARTRVRVSGQGLASESVEGEFVSGNFFNALGVTPALGRAITPANDQVGAPAAPSAVVSWSFWTSRLQSDPAAVGKVIVINDVPTTVIGVAPQEFFGLQVGMSPSLWMPAAMEPLLQRPSRRTDGTLMVGVVGRLKPGVDSEQALAELRVLDQYRIDDLARARQSAAPVRDLSIELAPAAAGFGALRDRFGTTLLALMVVVALLLVLACTNIASLLVARGAARQHEMALRVSLGAGSLRLIRQVFAESVLLAATGSIIGLVLAPVAARTLARMLVSGRDFLRLTQRVEVPLQLDVPVLLFTGAVAVATAVLFSVAPAWHASTCTPASLLRAQATAGESRPRRLFSQGLIVAQVAVSVVLLHAAALSAYYLSSLRNQDFGFDRTSLLLVTLDPANSGYRGEELFAPYQQLLSRLGEIPGVRSVSVSAVTPISGAGASRFIQVDGVDEDPNARRYNPLNWVGPRYFETFGTPVVAGREFTFADQGGPPVAIVNESLAHHYFGEANAIGRRFRLVGPSASGITGAPPDQYYEIVGVVRDAKYLNLREAPPRTIYLNAFQEPRMFAHRVALRTTGAATAVAGDVQRIVREDLETVQIASVTTMDDLVNAWIVPERVIATLSGAFGGLGAVLVALGLYGVLAYSVTRRIREIGVRMALGATGADIVCLVLRGGLGVVCVGLAIGLPLAALGQEAARRAITDLPAGRLWPFACAAVGILVVALIATYLPARRASRVDAAETLRA